MNQLTLLHDYSAIVTHLFVPFKIHLAQKSVE